MWDTYVYNGRHAGHLRHRVCASSWNAECHGHTRLLRALGLEDELAAASGKLCRSLSCKLLVDLCVAERTDGVGKNLNAVSELLSFVIP